MQPGDLAQLQQVYHRFCLDHVGPLSKKPLFFKRLSRKKDDFHWVAVDERRRIVGYISSTYKKGRRQGIINEIIVDPRCEFESVARPLLEKVYNAFVAKRAAVVHVESIRNPQYDRVFPELGFFQVETDGVFMCTVNDIERFLNAAMPVLVSRLERIKDWDGWFQIVCEGFSRFFKKEGKDVRQFVWTNHVIDVKVSFKDVNILASLLLGQVEIKDALIKGIVEVEGDFSRNEAVEVLVNLFPKLQFLASNFW